MLTTNQLVGYLRAQYATSGKWRVWQFVLQFLIAIPAAVSVVVTRDIILYVLAVITVALLVAWWVVGIFYASARGAAHAARRAALLSGGIAEPLSSIGTTALQGRLMISADLAVKHEKHDYYATKRPTGAAKLAEMIEESAFYSAALQQTSANVMLAILLLFVIVAAVVALVTLPLAGHQAAITVIRVILSAFVFAMSSDVLGAYLLHSNAAKSIGEICTRVTSIAAVDYPLADVLLAMLDYNEAVESAPESVPYAYRFGEKELNKRWEERLLAREGARAVSADTEP